MKDNEKIDRNEVNLLKAYIKGEIIKWFSTINIKPYMIAKKELEDEGFYDE